MGTLLLLDIPKVPSDSTIQELLKSVFGMLGMKNLTRLDSDHMCVQNRHMQFCVQIMEDLIHAKFQPIHAYAHVHIAMHHPPMHVLMDAPIHAS